MARGRPANPNRVLSEQETLKRNLAAGMYSDDGANDVMQTVIENATNLIERKADILSEIQKARILGTLLSEQGIGSEAQRMWIAAYLPRKVRGEVEEDTNGDDTEDTEVDTDSVVAAA